MTTSADLSNIPVRLQTLFISLITNKDVSKLIVNLDIDSLNHVLDAAALTLRSPP
jgi:hypothetical protein